MTDYLLVAQDTPRIEHYARQADGRWIYVAETRNDAAVEIASIGCRLRLAEVYAKIETLREPLALYRAANLAA